MEVQRQFLARERPERLGITQQKPKHPQYAIISKREESFTNWPEDSVLSPNQLAECGFVYTGVEDSVRCYYCGGGLRNWEPQDDPWFEHATWYPNCPHVRLVKGQAFIDRIHNNSLESDGRLVEELGKTENYLESVAALSCLQMGFSKDRVLKAINRFISKHGKSNFKGEDLCEIMLEEEDMLAEEPDAQTELAESSSLCTETDKSDPSEPEEVQTKEDEDHQSFEELYEENCRLKESQLCKICMDEKASIIFLPCGHMVTCPQCAPAFSKCPICRMAVNGFVKAYFAF